MSAKSGANQVSRRKTITSETVFRVVERYTHSSAARLAMDATMLSGRPEGTLFDVPKASLRDSR
jgi:hypothetical protein